MLYLHTLHPRERRERPVEFNPGRVLLLECLSRILSVAVVRQNQTSVAVEILSESTKTRRGARKVYSSFYRGSH
jgi:hypothetical protein